MCIAIAALAVTAFGQIKMIHNVDSMSNPSTGTEILNEHASSDWNLVPDLKLAYAGEDLGKNLIKNDTAVQTGNFEVKSVKPVKEIADIGPIEEAGNFFGFLLPVVVFFTLFLPLF